MKDSTKVVKNACNVAESKLTDLKYSYESGNLTKLTYIQRLYDMLDSLNQFNRGEYTPKAHCYIKRVIGLVNKQIEEVSS